MTQSSVFPKVAVVGAGAVGGYFGGILARAGVPVMLIGRPAFVKAVRESGLRLDTLQFQETLHPEASTEIADAAGSEFVLFCVKTTNTAEAAKELARYISPSTIVLSLQNGVNNAEEIRKASGIDAVSSVVYVAAAMPTPGTIKHFGRGDLVIGPESPRVDRAAAFFAGASLPCRVSDAIETELWTKFIWNCALNAVSGLGHATYGDILASAEAQELVKSVVLEVLAVARKKGVALPAFDDVQKAFAGAMKIAEQMPATRSSTAQDMARGKHTEIDSLNGHIARLGTELGVPTPVNLALYALVKLQEKSFGS